MNNAGGGDNSLAGNNLAAANRVIAGGLSGGDQIVPDSIDRGDTFYAFADSGLDRIMDFSRAEGDRVQIGEGAAYSYAQAGADVVISLGGGAQVVLVGVNLASLADGWIYAG